MERSVIEDANAQNYLLSPDDSENLLKEFQGELLASPFCLAFLESSTGMIVVDLVVFKTF